MKRSSWQRLRSCIHALQTLTLVVLALWVSIAAPGCSLFQAKMPMGSSSQLTQTVAPTATSSQRFDGVTVNVITHDAAIHTGVERHIAGFAALTGATVKLTGVPVKNFYQILQANWSGSASKYDSAVILPQWLIDFVNAGFLEDLTARVKADAALQWNDIAPIFRNVSATYQGHTYSIPLDGDFHMVYYRSDLLKQAGLAPPQTWDDYLAIAKRFHGKDLNGDGEADYGSCLSKRPHENIASMLISIAAPFLQAKGTEQGAFFDPATMKPLVNNSAFGRALEIYKQTMAYGVPQDANLGGVKARTLFITGRCALTMDWGDVGPLAGDRSVSQVTDKVGAVMTPGTMQILDRQTGKLAACNKFVCPYAIDGVNHAPYAANIGWTGVVHAKAASRVKDAAYAFLSYISQPAQSNVDVTIGETGFNPYRISQFQDVAPWLKAEMSLAAANNYLGAIGISLSSPNMVLNLSIPHSQQYLLETLDAAVAAFLVGKLTKTEAMQQVEQGWQHITNEVGREAQKAAYRSSLGLPS
ncbi:MAG: extracellular solute-binding protein [Stenomitos rutilans HA7619-LM2]|jgi:multiple sugar transport system substrate-binding protein|nr:extracellular solute-binding protein [Stenomitos rutilans HA7619-LM2]